MSSENFAWGLVGLIVGAGTMYVLAKEDIYRPNPVTAMIPPSQRNSWVQALRRNKGKYKGPNGLKSGQKYQYMGKNWFIFDFDADAQAPGGATLVLVSDDFRETVRGVEI